MANLAYFYYGESHEISDKILYTVYFPIYWTEMKLYGYSRYGIHWSDRKERKPLTVDDLRKLGYSDENLRDLGYTEEQLKER
jgi:hypothetical protein